MEQAGELLDALPEPVDLIVEFAIYTGFRRENIIGLKIENILFHDLTSTGEVKMIVKGRRTVRLPLSANAVEVLSKAIGERKSGYVFLNPRTGDRYKDIHYTFNRAVYKLGLKVGETKLRFHDLRHVFGTWLMGEGVSLDILRKLLGHKDRDTTDRYATLNRAEVGKVLHLMPRIRKPQSENDRGELTQTDTNHVMSAS